MSDLLDNLTKRAEARMRDLQPRYPNDETTAMLPNVTLVEMARNANGDLLAALARLRELEVTSAEERAAWDRYVAAIASTNENTAAEDAVLADSLLVERRKRFGGAK